MRDGKNLKPYHFKPGNAVNPGGVPKNGVSLKQLSQIAKIEFWEIGKLLFRGQVKELQLIAKDPESTALRAVVCSTIIKGIERGDMSGVDLILNRFVKNKEGIIERYESEKEKSQLEYLRSLSDAELFALIEEKKKHVMAAQDALKTVGQELTIDSSSSDQGSDAGAKTAPDGGAGIP